MLTRAFFTLSLVSITLSAPTCNWNGRLRNNKCVCYKGFTGDQCQTDCHCEGHGTCNADASCACEQGWKWSGSERKCVWDCHCQSGVHCIGPGECGCTQQCDMGACRNGQCQCYQGYKGDDCSHYDENIMSNKGVSMGINVGGVSYYSSELKWVDVARQSQEWVTQRTGRHDWDTKEHDSVHWRSDGYPARLDGDMILAKLMLRGFGSHEERGNYTILYDGEGTVEFGLTHFKTHHDGKGRKVVEFDNLGDGGILLKLTATNPANPVRNLRVLAPGYESTHQRFPFHPLFLQFISRFSEIRFMDFLHTNGHTPEPTTWSSRRPADFHTQAGESGGSLEYLVQLSNTVGASPWVCMPHAADDDYVTKFAQYLKDHLRPDLKVYVEYSNEVWNGIFRQTHYVQEKGKPLFPGDPSFRQGMKYFNQRANEVAQIWTKVWGSSKERLVNVWAWQTGYQDYYRQALQDLGQRVTNFQALAITGYFDCDKAAGPQHADEFVNMSMSEVQQLCDEDLQNQKDAFQHYMDLAKAHGLKLVMYEGGPGVMENGVFTHGGANSQALTDKAIAFNQDPHIQRPVQDVLDAWYQIVTSNDSNHSPGGLFNYFSSTSRPSKYGSWGMSLYTGQDLSTVPKWLAVQTFISQRWPSNPLGPMCSFVEDSVTSTVYGCFPDGGSYVCGKSADNGRSWTNLSSLNQSNNDHVTLDGFDVSSKKLFVRVTDRTNVNTYHSYDEHSRRWSTLQNFDYFSEEMSPSVVPRFPIGTSHVLSANKQC